MGTVTIDTSTVDGTRLTGTLSIDPPPPPETTRVGFSCTDADLAANLLQFRGARYHRVFADGASFPSWTRGKLFLLPSDCLPHISLARPAAEDTAGLVAWAAQATRPYLLTLIHEAHAKIDGPTYRKLCSAVFGRHLAGAPHLSGNGPIVTRYWLNDAGGDTAAYFYDEATDFGVDAYNGTAKTGSGALRYRSADEMYARADDFAAAMGVRLDVPELGAERLRDGGDPTGVLRADAMRDWIVGAIARRARALGWWQRGGTIVTPADHPAETATVQTAIATQ